jgi:hypothetical protein
VMAMVCAGIAAAHSTSAAAASEGARITWILQR